MGHCSKSRTKWDSLKKWDKVGQSRTLDTLPFIFMSLFPGLYDHPLKDTAWKRIDDGHPESIGP